MTAPSGKLIAETPSSDGLIVLASVGPERTPVVPDQDPTIVDWAETTVEERPRWRFWQRPSTPRTYNCGHTGPRNFVLRIWGREVKVNPNVSDERCPDCSLEELRSQTFRCCLCGLAVIPGEPVAVYDTGSVQPKDFEFMVVEGYALGCMNWNCCPSGGFFAGNWTGTHVRWWNENDK